MVSIEIPASISQPIRTGAIALANTMAAVVTDLIDPRCSVPYISEKNGEEIVEYTIDSWHPELERLQRRSIELAFGDEDVGAGGVLGGLLVGPAVAGPHEGEVVLLPIESVRRGAVLDM